MIMIGHPSLVTSAKQTSDPPSIRKLIMMRVNHREADLENHDRGLDYDLPRLLHRRGMLKLVAGAGLAGTGLITLAACGDASTSDAASAAPVGGPGGGPGGGQPPNGGGAQSGETSDTANGELPEETAGPYPGDGSNGAERADRERASSAATSAPASAPRRPRPRACR